MRRLGTLIIRKRRGIRGVTALLESTGMRDPATLGDMIELRAEVDATDAALCDLLAHRARLISRAAELKKANGWPARIGGRVDEVIDNARRNAEAQGWDPELAEVLWRELVEWSIEREKAALGRE